MTLEEAKTIISSWSERECREALAAHLFIVQKKAEIARQSERSK